LTHQKLEFGDQASEKVILVNPRADRRELISSCIAKNGSTLIITPDSQMKLSKWLQSIGNRVVNYGLGEDVTSDIYRKATERSSIILGGRKSLFAPMSDLKSIIILDDSYEQLQEERSPNWNAIDIARLISDQRSISLKIITSVPSSRTEGFQIDDMRSNDELWPLIYVDDKTKKDPALGIFSRQILKTIHDSIQNNLNSAIILNNKSAASLLSCQTCKTIALCENCGSSVSQHSDDLEVLHCSKCQSERAMVCLECKGASFKKMRKGIPSILKECQKMFPKYSVQELKKTNEGDNNQQAAQPSLYVGTEAILHNRTACESLGSVIFIDFDSLLFRNSQNSFNQSLVIVNRALRNLKKSDITHPIIISTSVPTNDIIKDLRASDFVTQTKRDLELRSELALAPYYATIKIESNTEAIESFSKSIDARFIVGIEKGEEKSSLMLRAKNHEELHANCNTQVRSFIARNRCSISVDNYD